MENLAPDTLVHTLRDAHAAILCRRDQLRLRRFRVPQGDVPFGQPVVLRLDMPFCRRRFDLMATVVSTSADVTDLEIEPIPGELELLIDHLERAELEPAQGGFGDLDEDSSASIEINIEATDGDLEFTDADDSGYWASLFTPSTVDLAGALDSTGIETIRHLFGDDGPTGVLRVWSGTRRVVGYVQQGAPLLFLAEPAGDMGNLDLALIGTPDVDLEVFGEAIDRQERSGDPLATILLEMGAIDHPSLLAIATQEAKVLADSLREDPGGRFAFWATEVPTASDGDTIDVGALLLAASILLTEE